MNQNSLYQGGLLSYNVNQSLTVQQTNVSFTLNTGSYVFSYPSFAYSYCNYSFQASSNGGISGCIWGT